MKVLTVLLGLLLVSLICIRVARSMRRRSYELSEDESAIIRRMIDQGRG